MTAAEHSAQRDAVRASLACTHHPDVYFTRVVPGEQSTATTVPTRVQARQPEEVRRADWAAGSTRPLPFQSVCTCGHLDGDHQDGRSRSLTPGPLGLCLISGCDCSRFEAAPVARQIPNSRRAA